MNIALVHDWLTNVAGAERVLLVLKEIYPEADIYTSVFNPDKAKPFKQYKINTTYLQSYAVFRNYREALVPFAPVAFESLDLSKYDMVISNTTFPAKGIVTKPDTLHICYCHTPTRYLWEPELDNRSSKGFLSGLRQKTAHNLRVWDIAASSRPDFYIANSKTVQQRINKYYRRDSVVVYPPVEIERFNNTPKSNSGEYYLFASRLVDYKRADIVVEAFNKMGKPLKIVGTGPEETKLKLRAKSNIEFLGRVDDDTLVKTYSAAKAFIFAAEEDFGIVPVEAMACGRPVIAYGRGGASETVVDGETGKFFHEQNAEAIIEAVNSFSQRDYDQETIMAQARKFSKEEFKKSWLEAVSKCGGHK